MCYYVFYLVILNSEFKKITQIFYEVGEVFELYLKIYIN